MSLQLLSEVNDNYLLATAVHRELADLFWFIGMPGYAMWNEYQHLDESMTQRQVKQYATMTYHTIAPDQLPKSANILEPLLGGRNRKKLKMEDSWGVVQEAFRIYQDWEDATLKKYEQIASELIAKGDIAAFNFMGRIIKEVKAELVCVTDKVITLTAHNWDMPQIIGEQPDYFERYEYLIKTLLGKSEKFHHWNSAYGQQSRTLFETSPDS